MECYIVIKWDDTLSKFIGQDVSKQGTGDSGGDKDAVVNEMGDGVGEEEDNDDDDEAEPDVPDGGSVPSTDINLDFNRGDPAGLRLGNISANDSARYHLIKAARMKAGELEEWKQCLNSTAVDLTSSLSMRSLTNAASKKAANNILLELQQYVC